jgi:hypothetical protein
LRSLANNGLPREAELSLAVYANQGAELLMEAGEEGMINDASHRTSGKPMSWMGVHFRGDHRQLDLFLAVMTCREFPHPSGRFEPSIYA